MTEEIKELNQESVATSEPKHYRMSAETAALGASMDPTKPAQPKTEVENTKYTGKAVRMAQVTEVIDSEKDSEVIESWYKSAGEVEDFEGFQKLVERVMGRFSHTPSTTPHAYVVIALAGLKLADSCEQGNIDSEQWVKVMWGIVQTLTGTKDEPLRILRFYDLLYPNGWSNYTKIPADVWKWMKDTATISLVDPQMKNESKELMDHLESIAKGKVPFGLTADN